MSAFDLTADCAQCGVSAVTCEDTDAGCCDACRATGGCTHQPRSRDGGDHA